MCSRCNQINIRIERYRALAKSVRDDVVLEAITHLLARMEAERLGLHPALDK
jgi:hypothetical protein